MRVFRRLLAPLNEKTADNFVAHLFPTVGQELLSLSDVLPSRHESLDDAREVHRLIIPKVTVRGHSVIGVKVVPPTTDSMKHLKVPSMECAPLFSYGAVENGARVTIKVRRVQHVELALGLVLRNRIQSSADFTRSSISHAVPCIELIGSRFPFYPPYGQSYVADFLSHVAVVRGSSVTITNNFPLSTFGGVLGWNGTPIQVGFVHQCCHSVEQVLQHCAQYAAKIGCDLCEGSLILITGMGPKVIAKPGAYEGMFGPLGSVGCVLD